MLFASGCEDKRYVDNYGTQNSTDDSEQTNDDYWLVTLQVKVVITNFSLDSTETMNDIHWCYFIVYKECLDNLLLRRFSGYSSC